MINLICESNDRPCITQLLLDSIEKYAPDMFAVSIIYSGSNEKFLKGYELLKSRFRNVCFTPLNNFKHTVIDLINFGSSHIVFCNGSTVLYRECPKSFVELQKYLPNFPNECFSFRLGLNTIVQNPRTGELQPILNRYLEKDGIILWYRPMYHQFTNYGYSFSVDLQVYTKELLKSLLNQIEFSNFMELESKLTQYSSKVMYMSAFEKSVAIHIINEFNLEEMNEKYLNGDKLSTDIPNSIVGCHQEVNLEYENG